jgi:bacterioferritin-associated ferredoxin
MAGSYSTSCSYKLNEKQVTLYLDINTKQVILNAFYKHEGLNSLAKELDLMVKSIKKMRIDECLSYFSGKASTNLIDIPFHLLNTAVNDYRGNLNHFERDQIICRCKGIELKDFITSFENEESIEDIRLRTGAASFCGSCAEDINTVYQEVHNAMVAKPRVSTYLEKSNVTWIMLAQKMLKDFKLDSDLEILSFKEGVYKIKMESRDKEFEKKLLDDFKVELDLSVEILFCL